MSEVIEKRRHFIRQIIEDDLAQKKHQQIITRFPPEPNGYLHIGHAKAICVNFGLAEEYNGDCHLRFDDTNPIKEEEKYAKGIVEDVRWLGFKWSGDAKHASDYYQKLYDFALDLIRQGKAYVDSLTAEEIRTFRGTLTQTGKNSPHRDRSVDENLQLFSDMKAGKYAEGEHVLRAKIDMQAGNINLRDPVIYRIRFAQHPRTKNDWCIYPMYDFAHPLSDALECITHSLCSLEFQDHRPLYDWFIDNLQTPAKPRQIEFARLNLSHTITSKRKLRQLVEQGHVDGWDDPRMPTLRGLRQRGYPPQAIVDFCESIGVSKSDTIIDMSLLENCVRDELNQVAPRAMCVMNPIKLVITNFPEGEQLAIDAANHPQREALGSRRIHFEREIYIERDDFMEQPPAKFFRLAPGKEVRLRNAFVIKCNQVIKDEQSGEILEIHCTYDKDTLGKKPEGRKVKGVIHWVAKSNAVEAEIRLYDRLFDIENPAASEDFISHLNPNSFQKLSGCMAEASLQDARPLEGYQFERLGYFCRVADDSKTLVFNKIVGLRDTWQQSQ